MEEWKPDLENLAALLINALRQLDDRSLVELSEGRDLCRLRETLLEAVGMARRRFSEAEREGLDALVAEAVHRVRWRR